MNIQKIKNDITDKTIQYIKNWEWFPEIQFKNSHNKKEYDGLAVFQFDYNQFVYSFVHGDEKTEYLPVHAWNYKINLRFSKSFYSCKLNDNAYWYLDHSIYKNLQLPWRTFQNKDIPKNMSLCIFTCLLDENRSPIYGKSKYHLGYFKKGLFSNQFISSIDWKTLSFMNDMDKHYSKNEYSKIPFAHIFKWCYLTDLFDLVGNPLELKAGLMMS